MDLQKSDSETFIDPLSHEEKKIVFTNYSGMRASELSISYEIEAMPPTQFIANTASCLLL